MSSEWKRPCKHQALGKICIAYGDVVARNQFLEEENQMLIRKIEKFEEHQEKIVKKNDRYEKKIHDARKIIDETAKEQTKLNLENQQVKKDLVDAKQKLAEKMEEAEQFQIDLTQVYKDMSAGAIESRSKLVSDLRTRVKELKFEIKRLEWDNDDAYAMLSHLTAENV